jgi:hypothetical protein
VCEPVRSLLVCFWLPWHRLRLLLAPKYAFTVIRDFLTWFLGSIVFYSYVILTKLEERHVGSVLRYRPSFDEEF